MRGDLSKNLFRSSGISIFSPLQKRSAMHFLFIFLQNIHLVARWLGTLEKLLEQQAEGSHENFRVFVSAEPSSTPEGHIIPQGILENSIKITNEPPTGMQANLHKALDNFNQVIRKRGQAAFHDVIT